MPYRWGSGSQVETVSKTSLCPFNEQCDVIRKAGVNGTSRLGHGSGLSHMGPTGEPSTLNRHTCCQCSLCIHSSSRYSTLELLVLRGKQVFPLGVSP
jgi:hypothetical protein